LKRVKLYVTWRDRRLRVQTELMMGVIDRADG
jgi:hypothetical protein